MAGFESFKKGRTGSSGRSSSGRSTGRSRDSGRFSDRKPRFGERDKPFEKTKVICSSCKQECEVPFKPTSSKPVYCDACFSKNNKDDRPSRGPSPRGISESDLDTLNEKLNKIMKHLKIE